ncbi:MAG: hypothetical protein IT239_01520, partial [Bacteroidia bacterium]|nr:hypothetical protein [Bacteroidia bacterium]
VLLFLIKLLAGLVLYLIYTRHYVYRNTSDAFRYFDDALVVFNDILKHPKIYFKILFGYHSNTSDCTYYYDLMSNWTKAYDYGLYNDNRTIIRANMFLMLFSGGNYYVHIILLNFLSFLGLILMLRFFLSYIKVKTFALALIIFLCPSLLFWGSGVLKEGVLLFGLGLLVYSFKKTINKNYRHFLFLLLAIFLLIYTKFYVLMAIVPALVAMWIIKLTQTKKKFLTYLSVYFLGFIFITFLAPYLLNYDFVATLSAKQKDFINVANDWGANSKIETPLLNNQPINLIKYLPNALITALFRPFFFDAKNGMMLISSVENLFYIFLFSLSIIYNNRKKAHQIIYFSLFFCITLGALIGWVTPILGAIVRYKTPLLPFLVIIPIYYIDFSKLPLIFKKPILTFYTKIEAWTQ